jgi:hypothetical protein
MPGRRVRLDEGFRATVVEADGRPLAAAQLSQGARDQLALALRWAIADLMADDVALPLVLDDPFLNWDADRSARVAEALRAMAAEGRQVWLLSHRAELGGWGTPVAVDRRLTPQPQIAAMRRSRSSRGRRPAGPPSASPMGGAVGGQLVVGAVVAVERAGQAGTVEPAAGSRPARGVGGQALQVSEVGAAVGRGGAPGRRRRRRRPCAGRMAPPTTR